MFSGKKHGRFRSSGVANWRRLSEREPTLGIWNFGSIPRTEWIMLSPMFYESEMKILIDTC